VWDPAYGFREKLPRHAHVVDRPGFTYPIKDGATLFASPCLSQSGAEDQALALPAREPKDESIRIGMVHGSTFEMPDWQANFPIAKDAAERRGFDYLAIGDTHSFRAIPEGSTKNLTVYPSAPEPTNFGESDSGHVAIVFIRRSRNVRVIQHRVAYWTWERHELESFEKLKSLVARADLGQRVLRVRLDMKLPAEEYTEALRLLEQLEGNDAIAAKAGIAEVDRSGLELDTRDIEALFAGLPEGIQEAVRLLKADEHGAEARVAQRALYHLYALVRRVA
jgi:DNA repair exonuclease SbcCD nuclease subunit